MSLAGGEPERKSARVLVSQWAAVLPGFDRTRHALPDIKVRLNGSNTTASANVVADHWLRSQYWQVSGRYGCGLVRDELEWRIAAHKLTVTGERGSRDIFAPAIDPAKARRWPTSFASALAQWLWLRQGYREGERRPAGG